MAFRLGFAGALALGSLALVSGCGARAGFIEDYQPDSAGGSGGGTTTTTTSSTTTTTTSSTTTTTSSTTTTSMPPDAQIISGADGSAFEGETTVIAAGASTVAAAWIAVSNVGEPYIAYAFSADDGANWLGAVPLPSPDGRYGSDPVLAANADGTLFLTWVGFHVDGSGSVTDMQIYVATAKAGTFGFGAPVLVSEPNLPAGTLLDKPWITVTPKGTVIVSYAQFGSEYALVTARSVDFGQTFTRTPVISDPTLNTYYNLGYLCVSKDTGRVFSNYLAVQQFGAQIAVKSNLSYSDDDGQSWPAANHVVVSTGENDVAFGDPSCTAFGNTVVSMYARSQDSLNMGSEASQKAYSLVVRSSTNGGASFDSSMDAVDTLAAPYFMLSDIKSEESGQLDVVYYAGSMDDDPNASFRRSRFLFGVNNPPSTVVFNPVIMTPDRAVPYWLGDYVGHFVRGKRQYMTYVVNSDKTSHVAFSAFDLQ